MFPFHVTALICHKSRTLSSEYSTGLYGSTCSCTWFITHIVVEHQCWTQNAATISCTSIGNISLSDFTQCIPSHFSLRILSQLGKRKAFDLNDVRIINSASIRIQSWLPFHHLHQVIGSIFITPTKRLLGIIGFSVLYSWSMMIRILWMMMQCFRSNKSLLTVQFANSTIIYHQLSSSEPHKIHSAHLKS